MGVLVGGVGEGVGGVGEAGGGLELPEQMGLQETHSTVH